MRQKGAGVMEFRTITGTVTGKPTVAVEVWHDGKFIASIYAQEDGLRIVSKYLDGVEHEAGTPSIVIKFSK